MRKKTLRHHSKLLATATQSVTWKCTILKLYIKNIEGKGRLQASVQGKHNQGCFVEPAAGDEVLSRIFCGFILSELVFLVNYIVSDYQAGE